MGRSAPVHLLAQPASRSARSLPVDDVPARNLVLALLASAALWAGIAGVVLAIAG